MSPAQKKPKSAKKKLQVKDLKAKAAAKVKGGLSASIYKPTEKH